MALINSDVIPASATTYEIEQSLRFNDDDTAYLSWTPSSAGNRKTWTWSGWVKVGAIGTGVTALFSGWPSTSNRTYIYTENDNIKVYGVTSGTTHIQWISSGVYRDPSAWYHIVVALDTTQATSTNRLKVYVNGELASNSSYTAPTQNADLEINNNVAHYLGQSGNTANYFDGYLSEVNFIDGQALDPTSFGETGDYGEWKPIEYTGTYGTNGFYLPFKNDYQVEGFSTVTYRGNGSTQYIGGVGFQPDLTWIKVRNTANRHSLHDSVRGSNYRLSSDNTNAEDANTNWSSFDTDGFTLSGTGNSYNANGDTYVAWSWDMGGSNASNTDGSITSTVRANPTYGQSIVSYTGNSTNGATVGHGLSQAPEMIIVKKQR